MERIKQALDRARAERQGNISSAPQPRRPSAPQSASADVSAIRYTNTRVVDTPERVLRTNRVVAGMGADLAVDAFKVLRTQVLRRLNVRGWNALGVTSPAKGDGKTLTAVNLALSIAREANQTVLLVDLDLRSPSVHKLFGLTPERGIIDHLEHDADLSEVLVHPGIERLVLLPGQVSAMNSSETLSSPKMARLVEEITQRYASRLVIFDLPPMLSSDDALAFMPFVDAVLLVLRDQHTKKRDIERTIELLGDTPIVGSVLNASDDPQSTYY